MADSSLAQDLILEILEPNSAPDQVVIGTETITNTTYIEGVTSCKEEETCLPSDGLLSTGSAAYTDCTIFDINLLHSTWYTPKSLASTGNNYQFANSPNSSNGLSGIGAGNTIYIPESNPTLEKYTVEFVMKNKGATSFMDFDPAPLAESVPNQVEFGNGYNCKESDGPSPAGTVSNYTASWDWSTNILNGANCGIGGGSGWTNLRLAPSTVAGGISGSSVPPNYNPNTYEITATTNNETYLIDYKFNLFNYDQDEFAYYNVNLRWIKTDVGGGITVVQGSSTNSTTMGVGGQLIFMNIFTVPLNIGEKLSAQFQAASDICQDRSNTSTCRFTLTTGAPSASGTDPKNPAGKSLYCYPTPETEQFYLSGFEYIRKGSFADFISFSQWINNFFPDTALGLVQGALDYYNPTLPVNAWVAYSKLSSSVYWNANGPDPGLLVLTKRKSGVIQKLTGLIPGETYKLELYLSPTNAIGPSDPKVSFIHATETTINAQYIFTGTGLKTQTFVASSTSDTIIIDFEDFNNSSYPYTSAKIQNVSVKLLDPAAFIPPDPKVFIFDIAEGDGPYLYCRGPGKENLYNYIRDNVSLPSNDPEYIRQLLQTYRCVISNLIHSASVSYSDPISGPYSYKYYNSQNHDKGVLCSFVDKSVGNSWYRWVYQSWNSSLGQYQAPAAPPAEQLGNVRFFSQHHNSVWNKSGIYQKLSGLTPGVSYTLTVNLSLTGSGHVFLAAMSGGNGVAMTTINTASQLATNSVHTLTWVAVGTDDNIVINYYNTINGTISMDTASVQPTSGPANEFVVNGTSFSGLNTSNLFESTSNSLYHLFYYVPIVIPGIYKTPGYEDNGTVGFRAWGDIMGGKGSGWTVETSFKDPENVNVKHVMGSDPLYLDYWTTIMGWTEYPIFEYYTRFIQTQALPIIFIPDQFHGTDWETITNCIDILQHAWPEQNWMHPNNMPAPEGASLIVSSYSVKIITGANATTTGVYSESIFDGFHHNRDIFTFEATDVESSCKFNVNFIKKSDIVFGKYPITTTTTRDVYEEHNLSYHLGTWNYLEVLDRKENPVALNFFSQDLKEVTKRTGGFSKTFELPASNYNQRILKTLSGVGSERAGEEIIWKKARLKSNGVYVFKGYARIEQVMTGEGGMYTCHLLEDPTVWPQLLGDNRLCDLEFDSHTKDYNTVVNSWNSNQSLIDYVYAFANYGEWNNTTPNTPHNLLDFHPSIYVKSIVDKIFSTIGYTVQSNFFESAEFKKLVIPHTSGEEYTNIEELLGEDGSHYALAERASEDYYYLDDCDCGAGVLDAGEDEYIQDQPTLNINTDLGGNFTGPSSTQAGGGGTTTSGNPAKGYVAPFSGRYFVKFNAKQKVAAGTSWGSGWYGVSGSRIVVNGKVTRKLTVASFAPITTTSPADGSQPPDLYYNFIGNDMAVHAPSNPSTYGLHVNPPYNMTGSAGCRTYSDDASSWINMGFECEINLLAGDVVWYQVQSSNFECFYDRGLKVKEQSFMVYPLAEQTGAVPAVEVNLGKSLPCVKQKDFLKGLTDLFNLHWLSDDDSLVVSCEPYDDFYGAGEIQDWTKKIDKTSWTDTFLIEELARLIKFQYDPESGDDLVRLIDESNFETTLAPLWSYHLTPTQDLYKKKEMIMGTTLFSPTMSVRDRTFGTSSAPASSPVMPAFWQDESQIAWLETQDRPENSLKFNIRIQNYYGRYKSGYFYIIDENAVLRYHNQYPTGAPGFHYPYMDTTFQKFGSNTHIPLAKVFSLKWHDSYGTSSTPEYYPGLYTRYYSRIIDKINGGVALRTCEMNLNQNDIASFNYRDIIHLKIDEVSTYWIVNKIIDYKPGRNELTKVELVEWKYGISERQMASAKLRGDNPVTSATREFTSNSNLMPQVVSSENTYNNAVAVNKKPTARQLLINKNSGISLENNSGNSTVGNGIAIGYGLTANKNQMVVGQYNVNDAQSLFQVGNGYLDVTGEIVNQTALNVTKSGVDFFGGEIVSNFKIGEHTITQDVYYTDKEGLTRKLYLNSKVSKSSNTETNEGNQNNNEY